MISCEWRHALCIGGFVLLCNSAAAQTNESPERLKAIAEHYARSGQPGEAAKYYEQLLVQEPESRLVVGPLLVKLYADDRQPRAALRWAQQVMTNTPDPKAYLAGVYETIGSRKEARALLDYEAQHAADPRRVLQLRLQLADLERGAGDRDQAVAELQKALEATRDTPHQEAARRALERLEQERPSAPVAIAPAGLPIRQTQAGP